MGKSPVVHAPVSRVQCQWQDEATMSEQDKLLGGTNNPPPYYTSPPAQAGQALPPPYQQYPSTTTVVVEHHPTVVALALPPPPDYLGLAICATIFFFPLGLCAIRLSQKVREHIQRGDISEAYKTAYTVRMICRIAYLFGSLIYTGIILAVVLPLTINNDYDDYNYNN